MNIKNVLSILAVVAIVAGLLFARVEPQPATTPMPIGADDADIVVYKTEFCGCCHGWVDHLRDNGLEVEVVNVTTTAATRERLGVPHALGSCHTAKVGDYWVEGHVPADLVQRLIADKPDDIRGIAAPGMPMGSPGMEGPNPVEYDVVAYRADGSTSIYATRQGKSVVE